MRHFQLWELIDPQTYAEQGQDAWNLFNPEALIALDNFADYFQRPIVVNNWHSGGKFKESGYRTHDIAKALGAKIQSQHEVGNAFDCKIYGLDPEEARQDIIAHKDHPLLSRIQRLEANVPWVHFDLKSVTDRIHIFSK